MGSKDQLLQRLKHAREGCSACGWGLPDTEGVEVIWASDWEDPQEGEEPEYCPCCEQPIQIVVPRDDLDDDEEEDERARRRRKDILRRLKALEDAVSRPQDRRRL